MADKLIEWEVWETIGISHDYNPYAMHNQLADHSYNLPSGVTIDVRSQYSYFAGLLVTIDRDGTIILDGVWLHDFNPLGKNANYLLEYVRTYPQTASAISSIARHNGLLDENICLALEASEALT